MENSEVLVVRRDDLSAGYKNASFSQIKFESFKSGSYDKMAKYNIVLFVEDNGDVFILKNRYGRNSQEFLGWLLEKNDQLSKRYMEAENFITKLGESKWRFLTPLSLRRSCLKYIDKVLEKYKF